MARSRIETFAANRSGMAATEFALVLPLMLIMFFGVVEGSDALMKSRRVTLAANTLADLTAQETTILKSSIESLFVGVEEIIDDNGAAMSIRLVSVILEDADGDGKADDPVVHWSYDNKGGEPYAAGADYAKLPNPALLSPDASLIVAEVDFPYTSPMTHHFISTLNMNRLATRWPRRSYRVQLCTTKSNCAS